MTMANVKNGELTVEIREILPAADMDAAQMMDELIASVR